MRITTKYVLSMDEETGKPMWSAFSDDVDRVCGFTEWGDTLEECRERYKEGLTLVNEERLPDDQFEYGDEVLVGEFGGITYCGSQDQVVKFVVRESR